MALAAALGDGVRLNREGFSMYARRRQERQPQAPQVSKKDQILTLYRAGITEVPDLAMMTLSRSTYVANVLHEAQELPSYFDLYTSTSKPMNAYSKFFAGKLSFRDVAAAQKSVQLIDKLYRQFGVAGDRAGQHHALLMALTMFDRARWTDKEAEADVYRRWLKERLDEPVPTPAAEPEEPEEPESGPHG
jgi:hypothetical protein